MLAYYRYIELSIKIIADNKKMKTLNGQHLIYSMNINTGEKLETYLGTSSIFKMLKSS